MAICSLGKMSMELHRSSVVMGKHLKGKAVLSGQLGVLVTEQPACQQKKTCFCVIGPIIR